MNRDICLGTNISSIDFNQLFNKKKVIVMLFLQPHLAHNFFYSSYKQVLMVTYEAQDTRPDRGFHIEF